MDTAFPPEAINEFLKLRVVTPFARTERLLNVDWTGEMLAQI